MFKSVLVLGHLHGIRIQLHVSWLIILALLLVALSAGFQYQYPDWTLTEAVTTALITALVFFSSIVAHELGHSVVAIRRGVPVESITLFIFGGLAQMSHDAESADDEFWIAVAGPLVSFALALVFGLAAIVTEGWYEPVPVALGWLALINLVVAVFNLIPGFPLDGGRVFRALVWKVTGDARKGINAALVGGRVVAYALFGFALWNILAAGNLIGGLWILLIGWFLLNMAEGQGRMFDIRERLASVRAVDLADPEIPLVAPDTTIDEWVNSQVVPAGRRSFLVGDRHRVLGLVSLSDAHKVAQPQWQTTRVREIMTPSAQLVHVAADTGAEEVLQLMTEHHLNQVPVMEGERASGWIDRHRLLSAIDIRKELGR